MTSYIMDTTWLRQFHIITYLEINLLLIIDYLTYLIFLINLIFWINLLNQPL